MASLANFLTVNPTTKEVILDTNNDGIDDNPESLLLQQMNFTDTQINIKKGVVINGTKTQNFPNETGVHIGLDNIGNPSIELSGASGSFSYIDFGSKSNGQLDNDNRIISMGKILHFGGACKFLNYEVLTNTNKNITEEVNKIEDMKTKLDPITLSTNPNEHQFTSSIFVNGLRSATEPHNDGIYLGKDIYDSSSIEMVSDTCYIDFVHQTGTDYTNRFLSNNQGIHITGDLHLTNLKLAGDLFLKNNEKVLDKFTQQQSLINQNQTSINQNQTSINNFNTNVYNGVNEIGNSVICYGLRRDKSITHPDGVHIGRDTDGNYGLEIKGGFSHIHFYNNYRNGITNRIISDFNGNLQIEGKTIVEKLFIGDKEILTKDGHDDTSNFIYFKTNGLKFGYNTSFEFYVADHIEVYKNGQKIGRLAIERDNSPSKNNNQDYPDYLVPIPDFGGAIQFSDDRLKYDEKPVKNILEAFNNLEIKSYKMTSELMSEEEEKEKEKEIDPVGQYQHLGVIAQDLMKNELLKDCVITPKDTEKTPYKVDYHKLFCYSMKAIQELSARVQELESKSV